MGQGELLTELTLTYRYSPRHPIPALLTQNLPSPIFGEGIEGWGKTGVEQAFEPKLTPMGSAVPLQVYLTLVGKRYGRSLTKHFKLD